MHSFYRPGVLSGVFFIHYDAGEPHMLCKFRRGVCPEDLFAAKSIWGEAIKNML